MRSRRDHPEHHAVRVAGDLAEDSGICETKSGISARVRLLGLLYGAGCCVSFLILAGIVIGVKSAGVGGWGMQMSNPQFVVLLTILVTLVALNLFGLSRSRWVRWVWRPASVASKGGVQGRVFQRRAGDDFGDALHGTVSGTGAGIRIFAVKRRNCMMFIAVAVGLAPPYVVLSWNPKWLRFLPKPGPWMEKFKIAMGFPMLGTAMWLFMLTYEYYGDRILWFGIFLTLLAMAVWVFGEFFNGHTAQRAGAGDGRVDDAGGVVFGLEGSCSGATRSTRIQSQPAWCRIFPVESVAHLVARGGRRCTENGQPVLVDFTAKWCVTCIANKTSIDIESVRAVMADKNIKAFRAIPEPGPYHAQGSGMGGVPLVRLFAGYDCANADAAEVLTPGSFWMRLERLPADWPSAWPSGGRSSLCSVSMTD